MNQPGHAGAGNTRAHIFDPECAQPIGNDAGGSHFVIGKLGVLVEITPISHNSRKNFVDLVSQPCCHCHLSIPPLLANPRAIHDTRGPLATGALSTVVSQRCGASAAGSVVACLPAARRELVVAEPNSARHLTEAEATRLAQQAVDLAGGAGMIYRNPRQPFSPHARKVFAVEGHQIEVRWGEISSPAIVTAAGYVFEIGEEGIELLVRPPKPRT
jgi:hypothetical protein